MGGLRRLELCLAFNSSIPHLGGGSKYVVAIVSPYRAIMCKLLLPITEIAVS